MEATSSLDNKNVELANEAELIREAVTDDSAFEVLYEHYFPKIYGYVGRRVGNKETTEDLVSVIFMKVFCNLKKYTPGDHSGSFRAWVYRIATNVIIDHYRKKGRNPDAIDIESISEPGDPSQDPGLNTMLIQDKAIVHSTLSTLPDKYQQILHLKYFAELKNTEIAEALDISANNVGVLLHRALQKFEEKHKKYVI